MLRFVATECGSQNDGEAVICGASNSASAGEGHTLIFVRSRKRLDDGGPYFELDDQSQGLHNIVSKVRIAGKQMFIELKASKEHRMGHRKIVVQLECPDRQIANLKKGLALVFRDQPDRAILG